MRSRSVLLALFSLLASVPAFAGDIRGIIVRVEPGRLLGYVWGWSYAEWQLHDDGAGGCRYTFIQNGLADRGDDEEGLPAGWHGFLDRLADQAPAAAVDAGEFPAHTRVPVRCVALDG